MRSTKAILLVVCGLLALQLAAVWTTPFVPTQDGPVHLEIASALRSLWQDPHGRLASYYQLNPRPEPNLLSDLLLSGLLSVTSSRLAEKLLLSLLLMSLPAAFFYCARAVHREPASILFLVPPLGMGFFFHMGFHNFNLAVPLSLVTFGYFLRHADDAGWSWYAAFGTLLLVTVSAHAVPAAAVMLAVGVVTLRSAVLAVRREDDLTWWRVARERVLPVVLTSVPGAAMLVVFASGHPRQGAAWVAPWTLLKRMLLLQPMISYDRREHLVVAVYGLLLAGLMAIALARRARERDPAGDALLMIAIAFVALYFSMPNGLRGGGYFNPRLQLFAILFALLWLVARGAPATVLERRATLGAGVAVTLGLLALHVAAYHRLSGPLEEYVSVGGRLPWGATVLPVSLIDDGSSATDPALVSYKIRPYEHALGYITCERPMVDLANYQADQGYFAVTYRAKRNPFGHLIDRSDTGTGRSEPIDLAELARERGSVDAVLVWGRDANANPADREWAEGLVATLSPGYELVFTSEPRGLAELYLRRRLADLATH